MQMNCTVCSYKNHKIYLKKPGIRELQKNRRGTEQLITYARNKAEKSISALKWIYVRVTRIHISTIICMKSLAVKNSSMRKMKAASCLSGFYISHTNLHVYINTWTDACAKHKNAWKNTQTLRVCASTCPDRICISLSVIKLVPQASGCHGNRTGIPAPAASPVPRATHEISICTWFFAFQRRVSFARNLARLCNETLEYDATDSSIKCLHSLLI